MNDIRQQQLKASDPKANVWVSANAGSGKTKILTDRYLRLLLNHVPPEKILCITFTKAGAAEMKHRILQNLRQWQTLNDEELKEKLKELMIPIDDETLNLARHLFTDLLDKAHTVNIDTIHSFCQSLIGRFPLECKTVPHFSLVEGTMKQQLLDIATENTFDILSRQSDKNELNAILNYIPNNDSLDSLVRKMVDERHRIELFTDKYKINWKDKIAEFLKINLKQTLEDFVNEKWHPQHSHVFKNEFSENDKNKEAYIWLGLSPAEKITHLHYIQNIFFTKSGSMRAPVKKNETQAALAQIINDIYEQIALRELYKINIGFLNLSQSIIELYRTTKHSLGRLDYNDLILLARRLLLDSADRNWVSYKLDGGIDHILLDEAQDTNPEQWDFIKTLVEILFNKASLSENELKPSLFVVGDEKQSIFRFQRADVNLFNKTKNDLTLKAENLGLTLQVNKLLTSFRSSKSILDFADLLFGSNAPAHSGMGANEIKHSNFHNNREGRIELLAPFHNDENDKNNKNNEAKNEIELSEILKGQSKALNDSKSKLAAAIAEKIKSLIDKKALPYENRSIQPGDIMILLRKRGGLMNKIITALKKLDIPVAGVDRIKLTEHIAVQDLLALTNFCLLPQDNLTCAGLLKSPFIGLQESEIYQLCRKRLDQRTNLWDILKQSDEPKIKAIADWLNKRIWQAHNLNCYDFFSSALNDAIPHASVDIITGSQAMASRLGVHVQEILQEFLDYTYAFEESNEQNNSLQEFLYEFNNSAGDVKREIGVADLSEVQIMSIHGAKGLESPIVILPDTISTKNRNDADNSFDFWLDGTVDIPFWIPKIQCKFTKHLKAEKQKLEDEEYHRLLYVAITRAKSHLYIYGAKGKTKISESSWYGLIATAFDIDPNELPDEGKILIAQGEEIDATPTQKAHESIDEVLPAWLLSPAATEHTKPITASAKDEHEASHRSPLHATLHATKQQSASERGTLIHSLLQYLPQIPNDERPQAATHYLSKHASHYDEVERESWIQQVLNLMNQSAYAELFSSKARNEVSISGIIENRPIVARIDLLLIMEDKIKIIDYKTSANVPENQSKVPKIYLRQMQIYKQLLQDIYKDRTIETAIIWTHTAQYMTLETSPHDL